MDHDSGIRRNVPTVFNFNLDSPANMEAEDDDGGHGMPGGGRGAEGTNPIPIPGIETGFGWHFKL